MLSIQSIKSKGGKLAIAALLSTTILGGIATSAFSQDSVSPPLFAPSTVANPAGFADLVARVKPAVVNIATVEKIEAAEAERMPMVPGEPGLEEFFKRFMNPREGHARQGQSLGSGFIIDAAGTIVTNNHVVKGATKITVTLTDGSSFPAKLLGRDEKTDIAVLKIEAGKSLPFVAFGDSKKSRVGDWVIAVGNPFGLGGTVTAGILSANGRDLNAGPYDDFLQIDAPINPGNSGGPLFDQSGNVIGISTAIYSPNGGSVGIGFAVPSTLAAPVVNQLKATGTVARGWLGVQMQPLTKELAGAVGRSSADGVLINEVQPNSPAAAAKLRQGDVILGFNDTVITNPHDLATAVANAKKGSASTVTIWRDGKEEKVGVTIQAQPNQQTAALTPGESGEAPVGLSLAGLTPEIRERLGLEELSKGVVVTGVTPDSNAAESGMRPGDVIIKVGGEFVGAPGDVKTQIKLAREAKKEAVAVLVMRGGTTYYVALKLTAA